MDVADQLQAYTSQIVALGQATLACHRRAEWLPDELANLAEALLALESALGAPPAGENADEVAAALEEPVAAAEWSPAATEAPVEETPAEEAAVAAPAMLSVPDEPWSLAAEWSLPGDEAPAADAAAEEAATAAPAMLPVPDEQPTVKNIATMSPVETDDWLSSLANNSSGLLILPASEVGDAVKDDYLVIDVEEEAGGGPATIHAPSDALPPLVVNAADVLGPTNVFSESDAEVDGVAAESDAWLPLFGNAPDAFAPTSVFDEADAAMDEAPPVAAESSAAAESDAWLPLFSNAPDVFAPTSVFSEADAESNEAVAAESDAAVEAGVPEGVAPAMDEAAPELRYCTNCGAELRAGRRFCHRCGESVARMVAKALADAAPPAAAPPAAAPPARDEWPGFLSDAPRYETSAPPAPLPAMVRFCNNCGLGLDADATVCPDCGSRDIS